MGFLETHDIHQNFIMSDDGTDYLYTEYTITVRSILNFSQIPALPSEASWIQIENRIRACLGCPRQTLVYTSGSTTVIQSPNLGEAVDCKNGPIPTHLNIIKINGAEQGTAIIEYQIKTWIRACCSSNTIGGTPTKDIPDAFVSHRWEESCVIDGTHHTEKTRRGIVVFRTNAFKGNGPDDYRWLVIPPLLKGFVRNVNKYILTSDNTKLSYEYTDKEVDHVPPKGTVQCTGSHSVTSNKGWKHYEEFSVKLRGAKGTSKASLITLAAMMTLKHVNNGQKFPKNAAVETGLVKSNIMENEIELSMRMVKPAIGGTVFGGVPALLGNPFLDQLYGEPADQTPPDPGQRGTANLKMVAAALGDTCFCSPGQMGALPDQPGANGNTPPAPVPPKVQIVQQLPEAQPDNINNAGGLLINEYQMDVTIQTLKRSLQLPTIGAPKASIVSLAMPTVKKFVDFTVETIGDKPVVPSPETNDPNETLDDVQLKPATSEVTSDGKQINRITGRYVYLIEDPSKVKVTAGKNPYLKFTYAAGEWLPSLFQKGLTST